MFIRESDSKDQGPFQSSFSIDNTISNFLSPCASTNDENPSLSPPGPAKRSTTLNIVHATQTLEPLCFVRLSYASKGNLPQFGFQSTHRLVWYLRATELMCNDNDASSGRIFTPLGFRPSFSAIRQPSYLFASGSTCFLEGRKRYLAGL